MELNRLNDGRWEAKDTDSTLYIRWREGDFNNTQETGFVLPPIDLMQAPSIINDVAQWLIENHPDLL